MTLERKLQLLQTWNPDKRMEVFERYHTLIEQKKKDGFNWTKNGGDLDEFVEMDYKRFVRYVQHWKYQKTNYQGLPLDLFGASMFHHRTQENKLRRYSHHGKDVFP